MIRAALAALLMLVAVTPLDAQVGREQFVSPDTALDAVHAVQQTAFVVLRDSTATISAAGSRLMSEMTSTSSLAWMRARARVVAAACARSKAPLASARVVTQEWKATNDGQRNAQSALLKEMPSFASELADCQKRWTVLAADTSQTSLRENAPYQMKLLQDKLDKFNRTAQTYLRFISVKLPRPVPPSPEPAPPSRPDIWRCRGVWIHISTSSGQARYRPVRHRLIAPHHAHIKSCNPNKYRHLRDFIATVT